MNPHNGRIFVRSDKKPRCHDNMVVLGLGIDMFYPTDTAHNIF